jgi:hypothetical protein
MSHPINDTVRDNGRFLLSLGDIIPSRLLYVAHQPFEIPAAQTIARKTTKSGNPRWTSQRGTFGIAGVVLLRRRRVHRRVPRISWPIAKAWTSGHLRGKTRGTTRSHTIIVRTFCTSSNAQGGWRARHEDPAVDVQQLRSDEGGADFAESLPTVKPPPTPSRRHADGTPRCPTRGDAGHAFAPGVRPKITLLTTPPVAISGCPIPERRHDQLAPSP